jgi:MFS family permease
VKRRRTGVLIGVSVLWIPLAFVFDGITVLVLPLRLGGDATSIGLVSMAGLGVAAAVQLGAGWASDRWRARVDRRTFIALFSVPTLVGLWVLTGTAGLAGAIVGYLVLQAGAAAMQAGQQTLIPEHVTDASRGRASGLKASFDVGGSFLAFLLLGVLLASGRLEPAAALIAGGLIVGVVLVFMLVPRAPMRAIARPGGLPEGFTALVVSRFLFLFATYGIGRFLVLLVAGRLGTSAASAVEQAGGLLAVFAMITAAAAVPMGWLSDRGRNAPLAVFGALATSLGIVALVPVAGVGGILGGGVLMSIGTAAFMTANWSATTGLVPAASAGRLLAVANLGTGLAAAAAGLLGPVIDSAGFGPALVIAAVASAASIVPLAARHPVPGQITEHAR